MARQLRTYSKDTTQKKGKKMTMAQRKRASLEKAKGRHQQDKGLEEAFSPPPINDDDDDGEDGETHMQEEEPRGSSAEENPLRKRKSSLAIQNAAKASADRKSSSAAAQQPSSRAYTCVRAENDPDLAALNSEVLIPLAALSGQIAAAAQNRKALTRESIVNSDNSGETCAMGQVRKSVFAAQEEVRNAYLASGISKTPVVAGAPSSGPEAGHIGLGLAAFGQEVSATGSLALLILAVLPMRFSGSGHDENLWGGSSQCSSFALSLFVRL
jgi:hypothetical protein